ncbi:hypothetical protein BGZ46_006399, partial [Entomortierella lignicola]
MSRPFVRAEWHDASKSASDSEFYITNICPDSIRVTDCVSINKQPSSTRCTSTPSMIKAHVPGRAQADADARVSLPKTIVDAVHSLFIEFERGAVQNKLI